MKSYVSDFVKAEWFSVIYRQLFKYFLKPYYLRKFSVWRISKKQRLRIACCNQLFKYVEQLPVKVLFSFSGFLSEISLIFFNGFSISSLSKVWVFVGCKCIVNPSPKSGYSLLVNEFTSLAMLLRNHQQPTCQFTKILGNKLF